MKNLFDIPKAWQGALEDEINKDYYKKLMGFLNKEYQENVIYPKQENVMNALKYTDLDKIKVVIIGQDPYHGENQAHGLCFSVEHSQRLIPKSLQNIYKELKQEMDFEIPTHGCLEKWANQGVLLLNTVLTVREHSPNSHKNQGWEEFSDAIIKEVNKINRPIVFMLWGAHAQKKKLMLDNPKHLVLEAPHPSPFSAHKGFLGCNHFNKTNEFLSEKGMNPIDWQV